MTNPFDEVDPLRSLASPFETYPENGLLCSCGRAQRVTSDGPICKLGHREPGSAPIVAREPLAAAEHCGSEFCQKRPPSDEGRGACACGCPPCSTLSAHLRPPIEALIAASPELIDRVLKRADALAGKIRVSHSEIACFRACPRKHHYTYVLRRESLTTATALQVGRRVEVPIKDLLKGVPPDLSTLEPAERALVQAYALRWKNSELEVTDCDVPFEVDVDGITVVGEIDAVGWQHKRRVLVEIKTTGEDISPGSPYWRRVTHMDPQVTNYLMAAKSLGWEAAFMVWDAIRKPLIERHLATPIEKRKYTKVTAKEPVARLYANQRAEDEPAEAYEVRILEDVAEHPDWYFARSTVIRFEGEHEAHVRDLKGTVHLMQAVSQMNEAPRNPAACFQWGRECSFFAVCTGEARISDDSRFQDRKRRSPVPAPGAAQAGRVDDQGTAAGGA